MSDLLLDENNDIALVNFSFVLIEGVDAVKQDISTMLKMFLGEYFLDLRVGMPYYQKILGQKPRLGTITSIFRRAILKRPSVTAVNNLELFYEPVNRVLRVTFDCVSEEGEFRYDEEIISYPQTEPQTENGNG